MRILIVSQYFFPENFRVNDLAAGLVERGHSVTVLTGIPNYPEGRFYPGYDVFGPRREVWHGVEVIRAPLISRGSKKGVRLVLNYASFAVSACFSGLSQIRDDFDAIFVFEVSPVTVGVPALFMSRLKNAPVLFWVLDLWPETLAAVGVVQSPLVLGAVSRFVRQIYHGCSRILVQSRSFIPNIVAYDVPPERVVYFPNWVEASQRPTAATVAMDLSQVPKGFRITYAGNIGTAQDFPAVLAAAALLRERTDIHWVIVGDGLMADWVKEQVRVLALTDRVHFIDRQPPESMPSLFAASDALLVSLKRDPIFSLTIPGKVQSYLAGGRPILAMLDGEGARIVEEAQAGLTCPAGDASALATAIVKLVSLPERERERMGSNGRRYAAAHFDRERLFDQLEGWLRHAVAEHRMKTLHADGVIHEARHS